VGVSNVLHKSEPGGFEESSGAPLKAETMTLCLKENLRILEGHDFRQMPRLLHAV
jgi:hypothetical protein